MQWPPRSWPLTSHKSPFSNSSEFTRFLSLSVTRRLTPFISFLRLSPSVYSSVVFCCNFKKKKDNLYLLKFDELSDFQNNIGSNPCLNLSMQISLSLAATMVCEFHLLHQESLWLNFPLFHWSSHGFASYLIASSNDLSSWLHYHYPRLSSSSNHPTTSLELKLERVNLLVR